MVADVKNSNSTVNNISLLENKHQLNIRDEKGRFKKGFSGNPNAWATRKLNTPLALLCREKVEEWTEVLDSIIKNEQIDPNVRVSAIKLGFEYGYGKPLQGSEVHDYETRDYRNYIDYLAKEINHAFDFRKNNILQLEPKVKEFIAKRTEGDDFLNKILNDVLRHVGSFSFGLYLDKLDSTTNDYRYVD